VNYEKITELRTYLKVGTDVFVNSVRTFEKSFQKTCALTFSLMLIAFASSSETKVAELAKSGQVATSSLADTSYLPPLAGHMNSLTDTFDQCEDPSTIFEIHTPDGEDAKPQDLRIAYSDKPFLSFKALDALNKAYAALENDVQTDTSNEMVSAVPELVTSYRNFSREYI